ncbi:MAG TPA: DHH family phosphoesterase [Candidatus Saccharimonadia bacterium]|nr:DHH family phosphoesterase [Candidatus Saccharimonadia bacterium]
MRTMDLTPKQQTSEAIRQAESIVIMTGQHPSVDQVSAVIGLCAILRKFGKKVSPVISDNLPQSVQLLDAGNVESNLGGLRDFILKLDVGRAEVDKLRYEVSDGKLNIYISPFKGSFAPSDVTFDYGQPNISYDLAIVLGVPTRARIDRAYERNQALFEKIPIVNLDFHRSNENYGAVNLIEPNASSLCEMLVALAESLQGGIIDAEIATALLMGIVASTDRFTASHTTSKSLTVAAQMMAAGARQQAVVKALYRDGRSGSDNQRSGGDKGSNAGRDSSRNDNRPSSESKAEAPTPAPDRPAAAPEAPVAIFQPAQANIPDGRRDPVVEAEAEAIVRNAIPAADFAAAAEILAERELGPQANVEPDR